MQTAKNAEKTFKTVILVMTDILKIRPVIVMTVLYRVVVAAQEETLKLARNAVKGSDLMEPYVPSAKIKDVEIVRVITKFVILVKLDTDSTLKETALSARTKTAKVVTNQRLLAKSVSKITFLIWQGNVTTAKQITAMNAEMELLQDRKMIALSVKKDMAQMVMEDANRALTQIVSNVSIFILLAKCVQTASEKTKLIPESVLNVVTLTVHSVKTITRDVLSAILILSQTC